jgi:predicted DNA-binding transcriptional regulator AlpA
MPSRVVGTRDIAEMLGVSRQRADQLSRQYKDFPTPLITIGGRVWDRTAVERWIVRHPNRQPGRPLAPKRKGKRNAP